MLDFKPPSHGTLGYHLARWSLRWILGSLRKGLSLDVDDLSLGRLKDAYRHSCLLLPNHCNHDDPYLLFALSAKTRQPYYYLAARESFTEQKGGKWRGRIMQAAGCYSVVRGAADRASFKMTRELIVSGKRPVVIFPEGELSHRSDVVMPFESGVFMLAFWGLDDRIQAGDEPDVLLVPMGIRYSVSEEHRNAMLEGLDRLEAHLFQKASDAEPLERLRAIGIHLLDVLEETYYRKVRLNAPITERIASLRSDILGQMERFFGMEPRSDAGLLDRARTVRNRLDEEVYGDAPLPSRYAQDLRERRSDTFVTFYDAVKRVCSFHAFDALAVERNPRLEILFETLWLIEEEVFGGPRSLPPRVGTIRVGEPILLADYRRQYQEDKRAAMRSVSDRCENAVRDLLK